MRTPTTPRTLTVAVITLGWALVGAGSATAQVEGGDLLVVVDSDGSTSDAQAAAGGSA